MRDVLGLMVDVNLHTENGCDYLEIVVESYPFPISYRGKYYYRSGSTLQELKGTALTKFLLQRQGKKWDAVPIPTVAVDDLKNETFDFFPKKATKSKRLKEGIRKDETPAHVALCESFVNALIHTDYTAPGNIVIEHRKENFIFESTPRSPFFA